MRKQLLWRSHPSSAQIFTRTTVFPHRRCDEIPLQTRNSMHLLYITLKGRARRLLDYVLVELASGAC